MLRRSSLLQQQLHRVLQDFLQLLEESRPHGAVNDPVLEGAGQAHPLPPPSPRDKGKMDQAIPLLLGF